MFFKVKMPEIFILKTEVYLSITHCQFTVQLSVCIMSVQRAFLMSAYFQRMATLDEILEISTK